MRQLTSPQRLEELAGLLEREAGRLDQMLTELRSEVAATQGRWEGRVADSFRRHSGPQHRQRHLAVTGDRLRAAARLARLAAAESRTTPAGGTATGTTATGTTVSVT